MKAYRSVLFVWLLQITAGINYDNKYCPQTDESIPTKCATECTTDADCYSGGICCPGFCDDDEKSRQKNTVCIFPNMCADKCSNNATCTLESNNTYKCWCKSGFKGDECETDINECESSPCKNMGVCEDLINDYKCCCPPGFTGKNCTEKINCPLQTPCSQENCPNIKDAICIPTPRYFIQHDDGSFSEVTDQCRTWKP